MNDTRQDRRRLAGALLVLGTAALIWYWGHENVEDEGAMVAVSEAAYFGSPKQAVEAIRVMLRDEDWMSLAGYYDLEGSDADRETMISGEFFIRTERPEVAHPGGFWRYKHPFAPSFEFAFASPVGDTGVVRVMMIIRIEQGTGAPIQEGRQEFLMRESEKGFQILPGDTGLIDREELLADPGPPSPGLPID